MTRETWQFINAAAAWFSALATFAAVVVALYLARKGNRIELEVRAGLRKVAFLGGPHKLSVYQKTPLNLFG